MAAKLIKTVKTSKAFIKHSAGNRTGFIKRTWGYNTKGLVTKSILKSKDYQIFDGLLSEYPYPLKENESVEMLQRH